MATKLFIERGYDQVTTAEIAERAEVSVPTLFNYFPTKESLVFDDDAEQEGQLVNSVLNRKKGQSVFDALLETGLAHIDALEETERQNFKKFMNLIEGTPALNLYSKQMWLRHEQALAKAIRKESKQKFSSIEAEAVARFVLDSYHRCLGAPNSKATLKNLFSILKNGWRE